MFGLPRRHRIAGCFSPAHFGTTLFLRHSAGVSLTASGEELLRHVDEAMAVLHRAGESIDGPEQRLTGSFVIGCHESLGAYFLPDFLERVLAEEIGRVAVGGRGTRGRPVAREPCERTEP
jgi:DNA-binding transcriptional LysR family regulator